MPNHFHFMIYANEKTIQTQMIRGNKRKALSEGIRMILSTYTQAINKQENRKGSLFTQNTKSKVVMDAIKNYYYAHTCFYYIHQNPLKANLVNQLEDWPYSSFLDYIGKRKGTLCNIDLAKEILPIDFDEYAKSTFNNNFSKKDFIEIF